MLWLCTTVGRSMDTVTQVKLTWQRSLLREQFYFCSVMQLTWVSFRSLCSANAFVTVSTSRKGPASGHKILTRTNVRVSFSTELSLFSKLTKSFVQQTLDSWGDDAVFDTGTPGYIARFTRIVWRHVANKFMWSLCRRNDCRPHNFLVKPPGKLGETPPTRPAVGRNVPVLLAKVKRLTRWLSSAYY